MLYACDALLPPDQRYASLKFRRYSRWFRPTKLDWWDALELVVFVETITPKAAQFVFHWGHAGVRAYDRLARHVLRDSQAQDLLLENQASVSVDDGLAVLRAMQDGGWQGYGLPKIVRDALREIHHNRGVSMASIAHETGLTFAQVRYAIADVSSVGDRAISYGSLGFG